MIILLLCLEPVPVRVTTSTGAALTTKIITVSLWPSTGLLHQSVGIVLLLEHHLLDVGHLFIR